VTGRQGKRRRKLLVKKGYCYPSTPPMGRMAVQSLSACTRVTFTFTLLTLSLRDPFSRLRHYKLFEFNRSRWQLCDAV
jgi:hypothetical protein